VPSGGSLEQITGAIGAALAALSDDLQPDRIADLLVELGLNDTIDLSGDPQFQHTLASGMDALEELFPELDTLADALDGGDFEAAIGAAADLRTTLATAITSLEALATDLRRAASATSMADEVASLAGVLVERLLGYALICALERSSPALLGLLEILTVAERTATPVGSGTSARSVLRRAFHYDRLAQLVSDVPSLLKDGYGWGTQNLLFDLLLEHIARFLLAIGVITGDALDDNDNPVSGLDLFVLTIGARTDINPAGLGATVTTSGPGSGTISLYEPAPGWHLELDLTGAFAEGLVLLLTPPANLEFPAASAQPGRGASIVLTGAAADAADPLVLIGIAGGSRIEAAKLQVSVAATLVGTSTAATTGGPASADVVASADVSGGNLVLSLNGADSFLSDSLPGELQCAFDFGLTWSSASGLTFRGSAGLDATLPANLSIGAVSIPAIHLGLLAAGAGLQAEVSATVGLSIGPVHVLVDRVGMTLALTFPSAGGNLGVADLQPAFKPPSGAGIVIDAGVVTGGGFLEHAGDEYAGALYLSVKGVLVKAYGLIQTVLPGGVSGYSFIAVISAEFVPPIQLPFGFSLNGVGGLIGIHRTVSQEAVEAALWAHHLDGLLFPASPVASAPQLLSALDTYFPAAPGRYIVGPMVKIGWSANLVVGEVAVLFELPEPLRVLLIGDIQVTAPAAKPQLVLHISFDGGIDFGAKLAFFDASLHDSQIAGYPISGDLAFRYGWGDNAVFALALGGFNPQFQPPAAFPTLKRLAITISSSVAKLDAQAYLALTSNTLQFGARVELTAGTGGFNVHGWLGFDALFEKDPLSFEFDLTAGVDLRSGTSVLASVHLDGKLSGPTPWHISGQASLSLLFFDVSVHFDKTWGSDPGPVSVPDPLAAVVAALADRSGWSGLAASGVQAAISPVTPSDAGDAVLLDPAGTLRIAQRAVPFDQPITRFGGVSLGRTVSFSVDSLTAFGQPTAASGTTTEEFAAAQFLEMSDAEKLSLPSFSRFDAGVELGAGAVDLGHGSRTRAVLTPIGYDTTIIDSRVPHRPGGPYRPGLPAVLALNGSADRPAPGLGRYAPGPGTVPRVTLDADQWVVANTSDLGRRSDIPSDGTKLGAHLALQRYLSVNPGEAAGLQLVLTSEAG
jgi:hypothetical protein